jgi:hypothetical protein
MDEKVGWLTARLDPVDLARSATNADYAAVHQRLFGEPPPPGWITALALPSNASLRDLYRRAVATEAFRAACGRISASSAW